MGSPIDAASSSSPDDPRVRETIRRYLRPFNTADLHSLFSRVAAASRPLSLSLTQQRTHTRLALRLGQDLLDRPAGHELDHREIDHEDAEQRQRHQHQAAEDVAQHGSMAAATNMDVIPNSIWDPCLNFSSDRTAPADGISAGNADCSALQLRERSGMDPEASSG